MGKRAFKKGNFHKLYLIDQETYNRVLSQLPELDRQDLEDLNKENSPDFDSKDDASDMKSEALEVNSESTEKLNDNTLPIETDTQGAVEEASTDRPLEDNSPKTRKMKPKRFACSICVTKKFTTKSSLKRHHKLFHEGQVIKTKDEPLEVESKVSVDEVIPQPRG